ncbi:riboflavin synthase subunit alpha [Cyanothece sp. BG0011]|uniref:riboflavin synthase subunit alpha n=1 Tax=Cyanothece sp. BG0011 TaxID=2082950 RepID=UPI000D1D6A29|nr:riboflavin synthase subunit alpha [Cyanothece sp. BG0011]
MLIISLITLAIASVSAFLSYNLKEDVVKAAMGCVAILASLLTLLFAPWILKLSIIAIPLVIDRLNHLTTEESPN